MTVRNLIDGSGGVASFGEPGHAWTAADALAIARAKPPWFDIGASHEAVDTEDALLVTIIESVTRSSFGDSFAARIKDPLG